MLNIKSFTFNPYQENTYVVFDQDKNCAIIDPGMQDYKEEKILADYISSNQLNPTILLNTHCHIDHVLGNKFVYENYQLIPQFHENELPLLIRVDNYAPQMGIRYESSPIPTSFLTTSNTILIGTEELQIIFAPGHSPGHLCFFSKNHKFIIAGDVLFNGSIGRTDLPGGNHQQLLDSIKNELYVLPDETKVYPGHGPETTILKEKNSNPLNRG